MKSKLFLTAAIAILTTTTVNADPVSFRKDIAPILIDRCIACHGPKKAEGSFRVDSFERVTSEGDSGSNGFVAKKPDDSEVFVRIASDDADERMPWDADPLTDEQIALVKRWIEEGATYDAKNPKAPLATIVPPPVHPSAPEIYIHTLPITAIAFSPDGQQVIVGGYHELTVWNPQDGKLIRRIGNVGERSYALAVSPDGKTLVVGGGAPGRLGEVRLFDLAEGKLLKVLGSTSDVVFDVAFNSAGDRLAVAAADGVVRVFDMAKSELQLTITSHSDWVMSVAWN
ncbi:MAG: hypothetical protein IH991_18830, partial [Planctomycetes bacterium]|nr:hypothetical protein [Planctomycetota bacterium]